MENQQTFKEWELDRDIPEDIWNNYLKKYTKQYVLFRGEERTWKIKCRCGQIEPYSLKKSFLLFVGSFPTPSKKTYFIKKIKLKCIKGLEVTLDTYDECNIKFREKSLPILQEFLQIRKRMNLSDKERKRRAEQANNMRGKKNGRK